MSFKGQLLSLPALPPGDHMLTVLVHSLPFLLTGLQRRAGLRADTPPGAPACLTWKLVESTSYPGLPDHRGVTMMLAFGVHTSQLGPALWTVC